MSSVNESLLDRATEHQIGLLRYSSATVRKIIALLNRTDADLVRQIQERVGDIETVTDDRLAQLLAIIREINRQAYNAVLKALEGELIELAHYESDFQQRLLTEELPVTWDVTAPAPQTLAAAVNARPFQGALLREWVAGLEEGRARRLRDSIRMGIVEGETTDQIVRRVKGTKALGYKDGVLEISRRSAEAMVRTAINHTATRAREDTYKENDDLISGIRWVSTLDSKTSPVCRARDGKVYPVDSGPRPPAHINCLPGDALIASGQRITGVSKRWFDGQLVVIRTAFGRELACTPNHPVLTGGGWKAAQSIDLSDGIICDLRIKWPAAAVNSENQNVPTRIEDIAKAIFGHGEVMSVPVPTAAEDFHGDGMPGEVAIVGTYRVLRGNSQPSLNQHSSKTSFQFRCVGL